AAESGRPPSPPTSRSAVASEMAAAGAAASSAATQAPRVPAHDGAPSDSQRQGGRETPEQSQPSRETSASANDSAAPPTATESCGSRGCNVVGDGNGTGGFGRD
ncbi:unnamed protein product, partial [Ectocarpus sp. 8 AP-2014]